MARIPFVYDGWVKQRTKKCPLSTAKTREREREKHVEVKDIHFYDQKRKKKSISSKNGYSLTLHLLLQTCVKSFFILFCGKYPCKISSFFFFFSFGRYPQALEPIKYSSTAFQSKALKRGSFYSNPHHSLLSVSFL